jgi:SAM-dependent methyltransferase
MERSPESPYDAAYYDRLDEGAWRSARAVVPILIQCFAPRSVVDLGCGVGIWLSVFRNEGVSDVLGIDGPWVPEARREIPDAQFHEHDLTQPLDLVRRFDLALCLEVAEHLPAEAAPDLVATLTRLAPVVAFSAAVPFQGGEGHLNERWPSFWSDLFANVGFGPVDALRRQFWLNDAIEFWYRQNMILYAARDHVALVREAVGRGGSVRDEPFDVVHPANYLRLARENEQLQEANDRLRRERERLARELAAIKESLSWRLIQRALPTFDAARRINARLRSRAH